MRTRRIGAVVAALVVGGGAAWWFLRPASQASTPAASTAARQRSPHFHGIVKDARGVRLAATLEATWVGEDSEPVVAGSAVTDAEGLYQLVAAVPATADGVLVLAASAPSHERAGRRVDLDTARQDFVLASQPARVTVTVKDDRGGPVRGAQVTLSVEPDAGEPNALLVLSADSRIGGSAAFEGVPAVAATLHWSVRAKGFAPAFGEQKKVWGLAPVLIEVKLARGIEVRGSVTEADGHGVGAADVVLTQQLGPWSGRARTDGTGAFVVRDAPRGSQLVAQLDAEDHVLADGQDEVQFSIPADAESWDLRLKAQPAGQLTGSLQTSTGRGIAAGVVDAVAIDGRMSRRKAAQSGADGRFRIAGLRLDTEWRLEAHHPDFAPAFVDTARPSRSGGDLRIRLVSGGAVVGAVISDDGGPLERIEAYAHRVSLSEHLVTGLREYATAQTSRAGAFRIDHLNPGTYRVEVRAPARMAWSSIAAKVFQIEVREGETSRIETVQLSRPGALRARFVAGAAETFDAFVQLSFMQASAAGAPHQVTVQRGSAGLALIEGIEPGSYDVTARLEKHGTSTVRGIEVVAGKTNEVTFDFAERPALTGRVERPDRTPVVGAKVDVFSAGSGSQGRYSLPGRATDNFSGNHSSTDAGGRFRVEGIAPGWYVVRVTAKDEAPAERNLEVVAANTVANIVLDPPAAAEIKVLDAQGKPLASKIVVLESNRDKAVAGYSESVVTDARGIAVFRGLPIGTHVARVVAGSQPRESFDASSGKTSRVTVTVSEVQAAR